MRERARAEHPSTLTSMNNLATVLKDQGKYEQAEETHRQRQCGGEEHPDTLKCIYIPGFHGALDLLYSQHPLGGLHIILHNESWIHFKRRAGKASITCFAVC
jgi:hypothetical protein